MYDDEEESYDEIGQLFWEADQLIRSMTVFNNYINLSEESRRKFIEKLTLTICYEFSPRRNYDIGKETIRSFVCEVLADMESEVEQVESTKS